MRKAVSRRKAANRKNGKKTKGPVSLDGKLRTSMNTMQHGFRADGLRAMAYEPAERAERMLGMATRSVRPRGPAETLVCARLALAFCRLERLEEIEGVVCGLGSAGPEAELLERYIVEEMEGIRRQMVALAWVRRGA
jgi:hypothetical protein